MTFPSGPLSVQVIQGSGYNRPVPWFPGGRFDPIPVVGRPANVWEERRGLNANARNSLILGFAFDPTNAQAEIGQRRSVHQKHTESRLDGVRPMTTTGECWTASRQQVPAA
jgi:hypothetical protein